MATALTVHEHRSAPLPAMRVEEQFNFGDLLALSKELVPTGFLPDHVKTPGQCAAIILTGRELGMGPMRALRSLQMVKGKVVESADSQLARFKSDGGHAVFKQLDEAGAVLWLRHPNGDEHTESFGPEDAKRAGLAGDNYRKFPVAMYRSRAITAGLKSVGWEGGAGAYDPDEAASFTPPAAVGASQNGASAETGEAATEKQIAFLGKLLKSSVWTQDERVAFAARGEAATKLQMTALIDEVVAEGKRRKQNAATEQGDAAEPEVES